MHSPQCSRRGMARLTEDLVRNIFDLLPMVNSFVNVMFPLMQKEKSSSPSSISRSDVWIKSHTRKNGEPVNPHVANTIVSAMLFLFKRNFWKIYNFELFYKI